MSSERYHRHLIADGFQQRALNRGLVCISNRRPDPVLSHFMLTAGAMGAVDQVLGCPDPTGGDLSGPTRLLRLNSEVRMRIATPELAIALTRSFRRVEPFVVIDVGAPATGIHGYLPRVQRLGSQSRDRVRYLARGTRSIVVGNDPFVVRELAGPADPATSLGLHGVAAAGVLLGDFLAASGAYTDPLLEEAMPRAPETVELPRADLAPRCRHSILLQGGGGALAHAFLEAILAEPNLCRAVGQLAIVDPDTVELTNLTRQLLYDGAQLGQRKAVATAREFARRCAIETGQDPPTVFPVSRPFDAEHIDRFRPTVVGLFPDRFGPRSDAFQSLRNSERRCLVLNGGTDFTYGSLRSLVPGPGAPCCFDCGPEELALSAARERRQHAIARGCGHEHTPSNVLTNLMVGALAARALAAFVSDAEVPRGQQVVNWMLPERVHEGAGLPACRCWNQARRSA